MELIDLNVGAVVVLYDQKIHHALALAGAPVMQHAAYPHVSAINFKLWLMEYASKEARLTYPSHAVVKDYGPPPLYHPGILKGLTECQYGELVKALQGMFTRRVTGAKIPVANWSLDVQTNNFNPIGHIYVCRNANVEELQELHLRGEEPLLREKLVSLPWSLYTEDIFWELVFVIFLYTGSQPLYNCILRNCCTPDHHVL